MFSHYTNQKTVPEPEAGDFDFVKTNVWSKFNL